MSPSDTLPWGVDEFAVLAANQTEVAQTVEPGVAPSPAPGVEEEVYPRAPKGPGTPTGDAEANRRARRRAAEYRYLAPVAAVAYSIDPAYLVRALGAVVIPVFILGLLVALVAAFGGLDTLSVGTVGVLSLLNLGRSLNIASWFSCLCFFGSAMALVLLAALAKSSGDPIARDWRRLSWVFLAASVDQVCGIHETLLSAVHRAVAFSTALDFVWIVAAAAALFLYFRPLMGCLPPPVRNRFAISAGLYLFGAICMEFAARQTFSYGVHGVWEFMTLFDRLVEMTGILLFLRALVDQLTDYAPRFGLRLDRRK